MTAAEEEKLQVSKRPGRGGLKREEGEESSGVLRDG